jgi:type III pantothenate kinase
MMSTTPDHQLAIDIGNTAIKAAVFLAGEMVGPVIRFTDQEWEVADRLVTNHGVLNIIYSTVANVPPTKWIDKWNNAGRLLLRLEPGLPLPFTSEYETMATLGQDRIAAVAGSLALPTPTAPAAAPEKKHAARLIVDAGTCMTLDLIDGNRRYLGGNISPGLRMRLRAMHYFTARLPQPEPGPTPGAVGRSTEAALRHGAQMGLVYEVEGLYYRLLADHPDLQLLLTGGDGEWLSEKLSVPFVIYPNLVLRGLNQILSYYVRNES